MDASNSKSAGQGAAGQDWLEIVRQHVGSLRYGVVEIVVHDSRVIQIEKTERVRLDKSQSDTRSK